MLQAVYYSIITVASILLVYGFFRKRKPQELVCFAIVIITFVLRALHIK